MPVYPGALIWRFINNYDWRSPQCPKEADGVKKSKATGIDGFKGFKPRLARGCCDCQRLQD